LRLGSRRLVTESTARCFDSGVQGPERQWIELVFGCFYENLRLLLTNLLSLLRNEIVIIVVVLENGGNLIV